MGTRQKAQIQIHAGRPKPRDAAARARLLEVGIPVPEDVPSGVILGTVDIVAILPKLSVASQPVVGDVIADPRLNDPLATGPLCWILADPSPFAMPVPAQGQLSVWESNVAEIS